MTGKLLMTPGQARGRVAPRLRLALAALPLLLASSVAFASPPPVAPVHREAPTVVDEGPGTRAVPPAPPPSLGKRIAAVPLAVAAAAMSPTVRQLAKAGLAPVASEVLHSADARIVGSHGAARRIEHLSDEELARMPASEEARLAAPVIHPNVFQRFTPGQKQRLASAFFRVLDSAAEQSPGKFDAVVSNLRLTPNVVPGGVKLRQIGALAGFDQRVEANRIARGDLKGFDERLGQMGIPEAPGSERVLVDGKAAFGDLHQTMVTALASAQKTGKPGFVLVSTFAFESDETGKSVGADLKALAAAGFKVHVLYDGFGSKMSNGTWSDPKFYDDLRASGVDVRMKTPGALFLHNSHMKPIEIGYQTDDGPKIVEYNGDMNIGDEYRVDWHGSMTRIEGPATKLTLDAVVGQMKSNGVVMTPADEATFHEFGDAQRAKPGMSPIWTVAHQGPVDIQNKLTTLAMIDVAPRGGHVFVEQPYVQDPDLFAALERAAQDGVHVHLIVPAHNNSAGVANALRTEYKPLTDAGVSVYLYDDPRFRGPQGFSHLKRIAVLDAHGNGVISEDGSSNGDAQSFYHNDELTHVLTTASIRSPELREAQSTAIKSIVRDVFLKDIQSSKLVTAADAPKPGLSASLGALVASWRVSGWID